MQQISFIKSSANVSSCPTPNKSEFAFIGRSNVGKSSLINMVFQSKDLAKISSKPGKTALINHFLYNNEVYIVDLPGYGFAKTNKSNLELFEKMISSYISTRPNLVCTFVLLDGRLPLQKIDEEFLCWCNKIQMPICVVFTKIDKISRNQWKQSFFNFQNKFIQLWGVMPNYIESSAAKQLGRNEILNHIITNKQYLLK